MDKVEANTMVFIPLVLQWNSIVQQMFVLMTKVEKVCEAVAVLADVSESRFEFMDDQVVHLRGPPGQGQESSVLMCRGLTFGPM
jgi:hypothetical protein